MRHSGSKILFVEHFSEAIIPLLISQLMIICNYFDDQIHILSIFRAEKHLLVPACSFSSSFMMINRMFRVLIAHLQTEQCAKAFFDVYHRNTENILN